MQRRNRHESAQPQGSRRPQPIARQRPQPPPPSQVTASGPTSALFPSLSAPTQIEGSAAELESFDDGEDSDPLEYVSAEDVAIVRSFVAPLLDDH